MCMGEGELLGPFPYINREALFIQYVITDVNCVPGAVLGSEKRVNQDMSFTNL